VRGNFEEQNKALEPFIIILNYRIIIIINACCNYVTINAQYMYCIPNKGLPEECDKRTRGSNWGCYCFLFHKQTVQRSIQCHVFAQSPPGRCPNDKYPVNSSHRTDLCKSVSLRCCLVATVIHTQSPRSQVCVHVRHNMETLVVPRNRMGQQ